MSVYIKGIEMPKSCLTCRFLDYSRGYYRCVIDQILIGSLRATERRDNCPLIPVPAAHGNLIDRDDLKWKRWLMQWEEEDGETIKRDIVMWGDIMDSPTIIPAEEAVT